MSTLTFTDLVPSGRQELVKSQSCLSTKKFFSLIFYNVCVLHVFSQSVVDGWQWYFVHC